MQTVESGWKLNNTLHTLYIVYGANFYNLTVKTTENNTLQYMYMGFKVYYKVFTAKK